MVIHVLGPLAGAARAWRVWDATYGRGSWWLVLRPGFLVASDPVRRDWLVEPDFFIEAGVAEACRVLVEEGVRVDMVAADPPWSRRPWRSRSEYRLRGPSGSWEEIAAEALRCGARLGARYTLLHTPAPVEAPGWRVERCAWLRAKTRRGGTPVGSPGSLWTLLRRA